VAGWKKKVCWYTLFGGVAVEEPQYRDGSRRRRPLTESAAVSHRGCSGALERAVVDFGADVPFAQVVEKLREHYGVALSASTIRQITLRHAQAVAQQQACEPAWPSTPGVPYLIAEVDGGLVPLVENDPESDDQRRGKRLFWKEAKICLAHAQGSASPVYGGTLQGGVPP
jgi:hypothetical protein